MKAIATKRIEDYINYMKNFDGSLEMKVELFYSCAGKIHLAFDLDLLTKEEKKEFLRKAAAAI